MRNGINSGISASDKALFAEMNSSIPEISPHGTRDGNFSGVNLVDFADTCWWSSTLCTKPYKYGLPDDLIATNVSELNDCAIIMDLVAIGI